MEILIFTLGFQSCALVVGALLILRLLRAQKRGSQRAAKDCRGRDMATQWENFLSYDGSAAGQKTVYEGENDEDKRA